MVRSGRDFAVYGLEGAVCGPIAAVRSNKLSEIFFPAYSRLITGETNCQIPFYYYQLFTPESVTIRDSILFVRSAINVVNVGPKQTICSAVRWHVRYAVKFFFSGGLPCGCGFEDSRAVRSQIL